MASPTFKDGLATDYVTDAVLKSVKTLRWEKVKKAKQVLGARIGSHLPPTSAKD